MYRTNSLNCYETPFRNRKDVSSKETRVITLCMSQWPKIKQFFDLILGTAKDGRQRFISHLFWKIQQIEFQ